MFYGISAMKCRELAFEYAQRNGIDIPASWIREKKSGQVKCAYIKEKLQETLIIIFPGHAHYQLSPCTSYREAKLGTYLEHIALPYVKSECKLKWFNKG